MVRSIDQPGSSPEPGGRDGAGLCRKGGGGDQTINLLVVLCKLDLFHEKLKLLSKLRSCVTFGRVEENAKHIDW